MIQARGLVVKSAEAKFEPYSFERRDPGPEDVAIQILFCGICHSDIHQARNEWGGATYPMVPGHEIVGKVTAVGRKVKKFKKGDLVGVGCMVASCRKCPACKDGEEQFCSGHLSWTYNSTEQDQKTPTQGGYSTAITVNHNYVLKVPKGIPPERAAPLLCAGITTYSPLKRYGVKKGQEVAVVGLGGLGHMGVKIAAAMGARVTVLSTSPKKQADAKRLGAKGFELTTDPKRMEALAGKFDFILDTVSAKHDLNPYLGLLKRGGTMVLVGVPPEPAPVEAFSLIMGRKRLGGSLIGGIRETQEMLDFCGRKKVASDVEVIPGSRVAEAYDRTVKGDVKYRFVIDLSTV